MKIPIVNEQDEILYYKERSEITKDEIFRISICWVLNKKNEILIAKRSMMKSVHKGKLSSSVAGTNEEGETYEQNIKKELMEEIGLINTQPEYIGKLRLKTDEANYIAGIFILKDDIKISEFCLLQEEVSEVRYMSLTEISDLIKDQKEIFAPAFLQVVEYLKDKI